MAYDLVVKGGDIINADGVYRADVAIAGETIVAIGQNLDGREKIDATGMLVTPGAVDVHVHLEMPIGDFVSSDDFFTGTRAAAFGGTTAIVDFVEPLAEETMESALLARKKLADPKVVVDYGLHMTIGPKEIDKLAQIPSVFDLGCNSFKLYMAYGLRLNDGQLLQALEAVGAVGGLAVVHAENWDVICTLVERNLALGRTEPRWHPRSRPAIMEGEAAGRIIDLATMVDASVHIFHASCGQVVERVKEARERGLPVSGETCPQYLLLTQDIYDRPGLDGALPVCSPPIRHEESQDALWRALSADHLQVISTDHCPFMAKDKATGLSRFNRIPGGVPSIEMRFPAMYTFGVLQGKLTLCQWVATCCTNPARLMGFSRKGEIKVGKDADVVIFDPHRRRTLSAAMLHENVDWTAYDGLEIVGWPAVTISRGEILVKDNHFVAKAGRGRYVHRERPV